MFDKHLTDIAGGNISVKDSNKIFLTPKLAGSHFHWDIDPEDILEGNLLKIDDLIHDPRFSREGLSHIAIYQAYPYVQAVIHAHPKQILPFTAYSKPIPPIINCAEIFGILQYHAETPPYSQEQADSIVEMLSNQEERIKSRAAAVLMPKHGIIVAGCNLTTVLDSLQCMDTNAYALLVQDLIH
jgi:L-fuculose-phosphate aldolase